jgi:hypothetical protein
MSNINVIYFFAKQLSHMQNDFSIKQTSEVWQHVNQMKKLKERIHYCPKIVLIHHISL